MGNISTGLTLAVDGCMESDDDGNGGSGGPDEIRESEERTEDVVVYGGADIPE